MTDFAAGAGLVNVDLLYQGLPRLPALGEELYCDRFSLQLGGGTPATLLQLHTLGVPVRLATRLGTDLFSRFAAELLQANGVTPYSLYAGEQIPVNITSVIITEGERTFFTYGSGTLHPTETEQQAFYQAASGAKIVFMQTGGYLPVYEQLKKEGSLLILDTGWDDTMSFETYHEYLSLADYYTPNRREALQITGTDSVSEAAKALHTYFDKVIIKTDKDGCYASADGKAFRVPPVSEWKCTDATGAGDAFLAGFAYGLLLGRPFADCIAYGNITGGKAVTAVGACSAFCTPEELQTVYKKYYAR